MVSGLDFPAFSQPFDEKTIKASNYRFKVVLVLFPVEFRSHK